MLMFSMFGMRFYFLVLVGSIRGNICSDSSELIVIVRVVCC